MVGDVFVSDDRCPSAGSRGVRSAFPRADNQTRVFRLIDEAIARLDLNLSGLRVLTEAASGAYVVTPLIAARAGAERVYAVARSSLYGAAGDVIAYGREWAGAFGVGARIQFVTGAPAEYAPGVDIVTNLGFVRPIDRELVSRLPRHAVVSLMWEPWEFRDADIDAAACMEFGIPVIGTNESDERLRIFNYVGLLAVKLLLEAAVECARSRIVVVGSDPFGGATAKALAELGAAVTRVALCENLDVTVGPLVERADAVVLVEHKDRRQLVGEQEGIRPQRFSVSGCSLIHIAGTVDDDALARAQVVKHPSRRVVPGHMAVGTDYVGPRPVIDLHTAGLKVGTDAVRSRLAGASENDAIAVAEASGLGVRFNPGLFL